MNPRADRTMLGWVAAMALGLAPLAMGQDDPLPPQTPVPTSITAPADEEGRSLVEQARRQLAENDPAAARRTLDPWIEKNERSASPWLPEALLIRGDALLALDYEYTALYDYEAICRRFPQSPAFVSAVERELDIGTAYANGKDRRFLGMRLLDAGDLAVELLIRVQERAPGSATAERAAIELADYYYRQRDIRLAGEAYQLYIENHPRGPNRAKAEQRRIFCDIARFKGPRYDASGLLDAQVRIRNFERRFPAEAEASGLTEGLVARLDESLAAQLLEAANWHLKKGDEPSARLMLRRLVREHPSTRAAEKGLDMLTERGWMEAAAVPAPVTDDTQGLTIEGTQIVKPAEPAEQAQPAPPSSEPQR